MKTLRAILPLVFLFAAHAQAWNNEYIDITTGQNKVIDLVNKKNTISLRWKLQSETGFVPTATVIKELGNFHCEIKNQILLTADYNSESQLWNQAWEFKVEWTPGTEYSGCLIHLSHPNEASSFAELVTKYNLVDRAHVQKTPEQPKNDDCATYGCTGNDNSTGNGSPDNTSDGPTRNGDDGGFDGGGYNGDDYNT